MAPSLNSPDADQQTPQRQSSGILSAFRNLTTGRSRQNSPIDQPILPQPGARVSSPLELTSPQLPALPVGNGEAIETYAPLQAHTQYNNDAIDVEAVGGPVELQALLPQLSIQQPLAIRLHAMHETTALLERYQVSNVGGIWATAKDTIVETNDELGVVDAGYGLLIACSKQKSLKISERKLLMEAVLGDNKPRLSRYRFRVLEELSSSGRNLDGLELHFVPLVAELLQQSYDGARKRSKNTKPSFKSEELAPLEAVFQFMLNVTRFNSKFLSEADLQLWGAEVIAICRKTPSVEDLTRSLEVLDSIITYSDLPLASLRAFMEVLCEIYFHLSELRDRSWESVSKLANSHYGPGAAESLLEILSQDPSRESYNRVAVRGAILIFRRALASQADGAFGNFEAHAIFLALQVALSANSTKLKPELLELINDLLGKDFILDALFGEAEWTLFSELLERCSAQEPRAGLRDSDHDISTQDLQRLAKDTASGPNASTKLQDVANSLLMLCGDVEFDRKRLVYGLLMRLIPALNDYTAETLIQYHQEERLLLPSDEMWLSNCHKMFETLFKDTTRASATRLLALNAIYDGFKTSLALGIADGSALIRMVLGAVGFERDSAALKLLVDILTDVATWSEPDALFEPITDALAAFLLDAPKNPLSTPTTSPMRMNGLSRDSSLREPALESPAVIITKAIVRLFLRGIQTSARKSEKLYNLLLKIAGSDSPPTESRIVAMKVLARLRSDINHAVYIIASTECENLAATVCRTTDSLAVNESTPNSPVSRPVRSEDYSTRRPNPSSSGSPGQLNRQQSTSTRPYSSLGRVNRPTPPLWMYGAGPKGLPEDPPSASSHFVFSCLEPDSTDGEHSAMNRCALDVGAWLDLALKMLTRDELEWETYSYLVVHLGAQLMNHSLFVNAMPQVKRLRTLICSQLHHKTFHEPPSSTNLKKSDVAICLYHILTMLISYHAQFTRQEEDEMVKLFAFGIGSWERTSESCIHALSICCHEIPGSVIKGLDFFLQQMTQTVTQSQASVHILEFLCGLARLPDLFRNFTDNEFRTVFAISFRYLQYVRDQEDRTERSRSGKVVFRGSRGSRELSSHHDSSRRPETLAEALPQYVYALAYHVMVFWFMALKLQDRPNQMAWIIKNLIHTDDAGNPVMEEQSQVVIDMMHSMSYSDHDETAMDTNFAKEADGAVSSKSWLLGMSILTVQTAGRTGLSQIVRRRPSGTRCSIFRPQLVPHRRHQAPLDRGQAETYYSQSYVGVLPDDIVQEFYSPLLLTSRNSMAEAPVPLPDDEMTQRSLSSFDRIPALDGHKIGVVYVGEGQTAESDILANVMGSSDFTAFLGNIGTLTELKGATFNTQGLDREFDSDGKFTFCWRDRVSEIVFHVPTMMPTNLEYDPQSANKKKHIGNDFVNIIFNNSGRTFDFNTFPSDFNYVNIVITPEARASFIETRLHAARLRRDQENGVETDLFYKVTVMTKPGLPRISAASETKILSGKALPAFIRLVALNANIFSMVWAQRDGGEHVSSWRSRLREIAKLRERYCTPTTSAATTANSTVSTSQQTSNHHSNSSTPQTNTRDSSLLRRTSVMFGDGGTGGRNSLLPGNEGDRASSAGSRE